MISQSRPKISFSIALLFGLVTSQPGLGKGPHAGHKSGSGTHGDLLGTGDRPTKMTPVSTATKFLSRGEALRAPLGRADDFSWPRRDSDVSATPAASPQAIAAAPSTPGKNDVAARDDTKKSTDAPEACEGKIGK
jgi:hypothetical protein